MDLMELSQLHIIVHNITKIRILTCFAILILCICDCSTGQKYLYTGFVDSLVPIFDEALAHYG